MLFKKKNITSGCIPPIPMLLRIPKVYFQIPYELLWKFTGPIKLITEQIWKETQRITINLQRSKKKRSLILLGGDVSVSIAFAYCLADIYCFFLWVSDGAAVIQGIEMDLVCGMFFFVCIE